MQCGPTWIDLRMSKLWEEGDRARHYTCAERWLVCPDVSWTAFTVYPTSSDHSWIGGEDVCYSAFEVAAAIERWSTIHAGLSGCPEFVEALKRDLERAEAKGTRLEIIYAKHLLEAMLARIAIAQAEDAKPFARYRCPPRIGPGDAETAALLSAWEADYDN